MRRGAPRPRLCLRLRLCLRPRPCLRPRSRRLRLARRPRLRLPPLHHARALGQLDAGARPRERVRARERQSGASHLRVEAARHAGPRGPLPRAPRVLAERLRAFQEPIALVLAHPRMRGAQVGVGEERLVLLEDLPRVLVVRTAVMHAQAQPLAAGELHERQRLDLAARHGHAAAVPVVIEVLERTFPQLEAAFCELRAVVQREAELQQVHAARARGVRAPQQLLHPGARPGDHGHFHHHVGQHGRRALHQRVHPLLPVVGVGRLHTEADLGEPRVGQRAQPRLVQQVAARVQARVRAGVQLARAPQKRLHLAGVEHRLAAGDRQAAEPRAHVVRPLQLAHDIALVGAEIVVMILVGIEAEIAALRAFQVDEERRRLLAGAARRARRRQPVAPQREAAVLAAAPARGGHAGALLARRALLALEGHAELLHRGLEIAFHLVERLRVLPKIHPCPFPRSLSLLARPTPLPAAPPPRGPCARTRPRPRRTRRKTPARPSG